MDKAEKRKAKELARLAERIQTLDVPEARDVAMTTDVKFTVTTVKDDVATLNAKAKEVTEKLKQRCGEAHEALTLVSQFSDDLGATTAELRSLLGTQTNSPPSEEKVKQGWLK